MMQARLDVAHTKQAESEGGRQQALKAVQEAWKQIDDLRAEVRCHTPPCAGLRHSTLCLGGTPLLIHAQHSGGLCTCHASFREHTMGLDSCAAPQVAKTKFQQQKDVEAATSAGARALEGAHAVVRHQP